MVASTKLVIVICAIALSVAVVVPVTHGAGPRVCIDGLLPIVVGMACVGHAHSRQFLVVIRVEFQDFALRPIGVRDLRQLVEGIERFDWITYSDASILEGLPGAVFAKDAGASRHDPLAPLNRPLAVVAATAIAGLDELGLARTFGVDSLASVFANEVALSRRVPVPRAAHRTPFLRRSERRF
jgi:hypothetical protein